MPFQLTEPLDGWREFVREIGIIVIGVLLALGADQAVQAVHDREDVAQLRDALKGELADDRARWEYMIAADRCTLRRLEVLNRWLATAPSGTKLPDAYPVFLMNLHSSSWDLAKTSEAAAQIPLRERLTYASLYAALENWREHIRNENANMQLIGALFETADQPEDREQIRLLLSRARIMVRFRQASSPYIIDRFRALSIQPDAQTLQYAPDPEVACKPLKS